MWHQSACTLITMVVSFIDIYGLGTRIAQTLLKYKSYPHEYCIPK